jgi:hypothetical protein
MARTRQIAVPVPEDLEAAARATAPELASLPLGTLVRVGLAMLAGHQQVDDAIRVAIGYRQPPGPRGSRPRPSEVAA